jgi:hypothetical protein
MKTSEIRIERTIISPNGFKWKIIRNYGGLLLIKSIEKDGGHPLGTCKFLFSGQFRMFQATMIKKKKKHKRIGVCRVCGCTDDRACPGGCFWVEPDLCSSCMDKTYFCHLTQRPLKRRCQYIHTCSAKEPKCEKKGYHAMRAKRAEHAKN